MSKRKPEVLVADMRGAMDRIERYVVGMDHDAFLADDKTVDAVVRNLEIIGEASRKMPDDFKTRHPSVPWAQMAGLRNRVVHDYTGVDLEIVWEIVKTSLPELRKQLDSMA
jgi:uncharacterized protein with HEPN domain